MHGTRYRNFPVKVEEMYLDSWGPKYICLNQYRKFEARTFGGNIFRVGRWTSNISTWGGVNDKYTEQIPTKCKIKIKTAGSLINGPEQESSPKNRKRDRNLKKHVFSWDDGFCNARASLVVAMIAIQVARLKIPKFSLHITRMKPC